MVLQLFKEILHFHQTYVLLTVLVNVFSMSCYKIGYTMLPCDIPRDILLISCGFLVYRLSLNDFWNSMA